MAREITERKQADAELRDNEEKLPALYASMTKGLAIHKIVYDEYGTPIDYLITDVNPAFEKVLGIKKAEVLGARASLPYGAGESPYLDIHASVAATREPVIFETYFPPLNKHFSISVFSPAEGMFATIFRDVSESKRMEQSLRERETQLRRLTDNMLDVMVIAFWAR